MAFPGAEGAKRAGFRQSFFLSGHLNGSGAKGKRGKKGRFFEVAFTHGGDILPAFSGGSGPSECPFLVCDHIRRRAVTVCRFSVACVSPSSRQLPPPEAARSLYGAQDAVIRPGTMEPWTEVQGIKKGPFSGPCRAFTPAGCTLLLFCFLIHHIASFSPHDWRQDTPG